MAKLVYTATNPVQDHLQSKWARIKALLRNRGFVEDYAHARERWRDGALVAFPPGTYWLRRFPYVPVPRRERGCGSALATK
jgi:hypothetical protein